LATFTWNGGSASAGDPNQWTLNGTTPAGPPGPNDSAIVTSGTVLGGNNTQLHNNTLYIGSAAFITGGDTSTTFMSPTFDDQTVLTSAVPGASTAENSLLVATDRFVNQGTIDAAGPTGSTFTIQVTTDGTLPGTFINYSQISVEAGNAMFIDIAGTSELMNVGEVQVNGGTLVINAATNAIAGGYAPLSGTAIIDGGGTIETNVGYASNVGGVSPYYAFADTTGGNTLKIDNIGSFGGVIIGFGVNDTIDLGASLAVAKVVYTPSTSILSLKNSAGTILASLQISGAFQSGTFDVSGTTAGSFNLNTGADGDTLLTTGVPVDLYNNTDGTWQTAANWSNGVPGTSDVPFIGLNATTPFTLTTGTTAVQAGGVSLVDKDLLQITSDTTFGPNSITAFDGTLEVTSGNEVTAPAYRSTGGTLVVDPGATFDLLGRPVINSVGAVNGTLASVAIGGTNALRLFGGNILVDGGTLNAAPGQLDGNGGSLQIGYDGGGTPATMTVQSSGTNAAIVRDTYVVLSSDPTSFGSLTLSGNVSWTDEIDSNDNTTRGYMEIGYNNVVSNTPTGVVPAPFSNAASLQVLNGATLTEQGYANIADTPDSAGVVQIGTGAVWDVGLVHGGFINVGLCGEGILTIDGGTVSTGNVGTFFTNGTISSTGGGIGIGISADASGTMVVENGGQFFSADGMAIGRGAGAIATPGANGTLDVLNGGTVDITNGGVNVGSNAQVVGSVEVSGNNAVFEFTGTAGGMNVGSLGQGTFDVGNGGTLLMDGARGISVGASIGSTGTLIVGGAGALISFGTTSSGLTVGQSGSGTLEIASGGSIVLNGTSGINVGQSVGGNGLLIIDGPSALLSEGATDGGINVGQATSGTLDIESGGTFDMNGTNAIVVGQSVGSSGLIIVNGGVINEGTASNGMIIGQSGPGTMDVSGGGAVTVGKGPLLIGDVGSGGTVSVVGAGSEINVLGTSGINVGNGGGGTLIINAGTVVSSSFFSVAAGGQTLGSGNVQMIGGTLSAAGLSIGQAGQGTLGIGGGGIVTAGTNSFSIGFGAGSNGSVSLNNGTLTETSGFFSVGGTNASGTLFVGNNGVLKTGGASFLSDINATGTGQANATIGGGHWTVLGQLIVGDTGNGTLNINSLGVVNAGINSVNIGNQAGGNGSVSVSGGGTLVAGFLGVATTVTGVANGTLTVGSGGDVQVNSVTEGPGNISVTGGSLTATSGITVGFNGTGAVLNIGSLGVVSETGTSVPFSIGSGTTTVSSGTVSVATGGTLSSASPINLGGSPAGSSGTLTVNGGVVSETSSLSLGASNGSTGTVTVTSGTLTTKGNLSVGGFGSGLLVVDSGGTVNANGGIVVDPIGGGNGTLVVNGGSLNSTNLTIGNGATATATIEAGGILTASGTSPYTIGNGLGGSGSVTVDAAMFSTSGQPLFIGNGGNGALTVQNGGTVITSFTSAGDVADINASPGRQASVTVTGASSLWQLGASTINPLVVGDTGNGMLTIAAGGKVSDSGAGVNIGNQSGGSGTVIVNGGQLIDLGGIGTIAASGANGTLAVGSGGTVAISFLTIGTNGLVSMNGGTLSVNGAPGITNNGLIRGFGTLATSLNSAGSVTAVGGTLEVGGTIASSQSVSFGGASVALQLDSLSGTVESFVLSNWQNTDELILNNGSTVLGAEWLNNGSSIGTLEVDTNGGTIDFTNVTLAVATTPTFSTGSNFVELVSCFAAGTRIAAPDGEVAVEALQVGDSVMLASGELERVVWIGHRTIDCARHPRPQQVWPVRIAAKAFGAVPDRDLFLSPDHAVLIDGVLVPVKHLIDGDAIAQVQVDSVRYYHVELTRHAVLQAEGLPAESYLDVGDRSHFANGGVVVALHPDLACRIWEAEACAPLVVAGPRLDAAKRRLRAA
jgi:T5SS/PEP-CTERM-associated repeat protein